MAKNAIYTASCAECGAVRAAAVDDPRWQKENAKDIAGWIRGGLVINRVVGEVMITRHAPTCSKAAPTTSAAAPLPSPAAEPEKDTPND